MRYSRTIEKNLKLGNFSKSYILGIKWFLSTDLRIEESKQRFFSRPRVSCRRMLLLQLKNLSSFFIMSSSCICSWFSLTIHIFLRNSKTMTSKWKSLRSSILTKYSRILLFFIFLSIWKSSARLSRIDRQMQKSLSCLPITLLSLFISLSRSCLVIVVFVWLNSSTLVSQRWIQYSNIFIILSPI